MIPYKLQQLIEGYKDFSKVRNHYLQDSFPLHDERIDLTGIASSIIAYKELISALMKYYPVIAMRDEHNLSLGIWACGKVTIVELYKQALLCFINAIEKEKFSKRKIGRIDQAAYRNKLIGEVSAELIKLRYTIERPFNLEEFKTRQLLKDYIKNVPRLNTLKAYK